MRKNHVGNRITEYMLYKQGYCQIRKYMEMLSSDFDDAISTFYHVTTWSLIQYKDDNSVWNPIVEITRS